MALNRKDVNNRNVRVPESTSLIKPRYHGIEMERLLRDLRSAQKKIVRMTARIKSGELKVVPKNHINDLIFATDELERFVNNLEWLQVDRVDKDGKE
nr:MAG TPA: hypothetical protein [Caudoviricetes sp.]